MGLGAFISPVSSIPPAFCWAGNGLQTGGEVGLVDLISLKQDSTGGRAEGVNRLTVE